MTKDLGKTTLMVIKSQRRFVIYGTDIDDDITFTENIRIASSYQV